jgi:VIT1/CCC1 family predicted Fe2+/Mn2+ transporter
MPVVLDPALIGPIMLVVVFAALAAPAAFLAKRRGRSVVIWGAMGILAPLLSILVVLMLGHKKTADAHY